MTRESHGDRTPVGDSGGGARGRARMRLALGIAQMAASAFALGLLFVEGISSRALIATVVACTLTSASVLLFGAHRKAR